MVTADAANKTEIGSIDIGGALQQHRANSTACTTRKAAELNVAQVRHLGNIR